MFYVKMSFVLLFFCPKQENTVDLTCSSGDESNHGEIMKILITLVSFNEMLLKIAIHDWIYAGGCEFYTVLFIITQSHSMYY